MTIWEALNSGEIFTRPNPLWENEDIWFFGPELTNEDRRFLTIEDILANDWYIEEDFEKIFVDMLERGVVSEW